MPEVNGFDFLDAFAGMPAEVHQTCDIMMLSSSLDPNDQRRVDENIFVSKFLDKPLNKEKLLSIIQQKPELQQP